MCDLTNQPRETEVQECRTVKITSFFSLGSYVLLFIPLGKIRMFGITCGYQFNQRDFNLQVRSHGPILDTLPTSVRFDALIFILQHSISPKKANSDTILHFSNNFTFDSAGCINKRDQCGTQSIAMKCSKSQRTRQLRKVIQASSSHNKPGR